MFDPEEHFMGENVVKGAAWLDKELPGWELLIDLGRLNLNSYCNCILGQSFGDYCNVKTEGAEEDWNGRYVPPLPWADEHGFNVMWWCKGDFELLTETWKTFIKDRLDHGIRL